MMWIASLRAIKQRDSQDTDSLCESHFYRRPATESAELAAALGRRDPQPQAGRHAEVMLLQGREYGCGFESVCYENGSLTLLKPGEQS